jgi:transcriptional regulator with XRE-family HTH domain
MKNLKVKRLSNELTQKQLAQKTGLSQSYINELENGRKSNPSMSVVVKLARALGVPVSELLGEEIKGLINSRKEYVAI